MKLFFLNVTVNWQNCLFQFVIIGIHGTIEYLTRSLLTQLDFFLWGYLKSEVYFSGPADI